MQDTAGAQAVKQAAPRLPISKCKRIAKTDPDYMLTSQSASAAVAFATELFIQALTEDALARSQIERPTGSRLRLQYDDVAQSVATLDRYSFLCDVVPQTRTLATLTRENRVRYTALAPGQATLPFRARDEPGEASEPETPLKRYARKHKSRSVNKEITMGIFTGDNDKDTQDYTDKLVRNSPSERVRDGVHSVGDSLKSLWQQAVNSDDNPFSDIWLNASGGLVDVLSGLGLPGGFAHPSRIRTLMDDVTEEEGNTGLYGYRTPTNTQFERCQEVKGLSVWDSHGLWRCLFPEAVVKSKVQTDQLANVITREKVERDKHHNLGLFFTEYSSYLTWRSQMMQLAKRRQSDYWASATPEDLTDLATGKKVVGTSEYVTYNTTDYGQEQIKETKTYYDDGTVKLRSEKRHNSADGKPKVESIEKILTEDEAKDGWFWRK